MFIDLGVLLVLFLASQFLMVSLEKSQHPAAYDDVSVRQQADHDRRRDTTSAANKKASGADKTYADLVKTKGANAPETQAALAAKKPPDDAVKDAKAQQKKLNDQLTKDESTLAPISNLVSGVFFLVSLVSAPDPEPVRRGRPSANASRRSASCGSTARPPRFGDLFRRYAVLVFAAYVLSSFLRSPVGALIVVFVATMWTRNPNQQALHDRFAKTLVVTDAEE